MCGDKPASFVLPTALEREDIMMRVGRLVKRRRLAPATVWGMGLTALAQAEVVSELVVQWDHSCQGQPEVIEELRRIFLHHAATPGNSRQGGGA
jgi:hypothetical protein